jgi:hypothetical protein
MPYSNIVFVKLFLSLFEEDDRFLYQLNESQQLLYIKLLYLAAASGNQITKNYRFISHKINYHHDENCLKADIERIAIVFPRFKELNGVYIFEKFNELHNFVSTKKQPSGWNTPRGEYPRNWDAIKKSVVTRAGNKCELCQATEESFDRKNNKFRVHHKDGNKSNNELDNLLYVCLFCHGNLHRQLNGISAGISARSEQNKSREEEEKNKKKNKTIPPTIEEVSAYCKERGGLVDPMKWMDHYTAKGWMIGKNKMVDWKAAVRTWEKEAKPEPYRDQL